MGVDYDSKLIIGWHIDSYDLEKWLAKNKIGSCRDMEDQCLHYDCWTGIEEFIPEGLKIITAGNMYGHDNGYEFYLVINKQQSYTIAEIAAMAVEKTDVIKKGSMLIEEISGETKELNVFSAIKIW